MALTAKEELEKVLKAKGKSQYLTKAWSLVFEAAIEENIAILERSFSQEAIKELYPIVVKAKAEYDAELEADEAANKLIYETAVYFDDEVLDDLESYAQIFDDGHVEVVSTGAKGLGDRLPKVGRKYIGNRDDIRWRFNDTSQLPLIRRVVEIVIDQKGNQK